jgi:hypothetical protein
VEELQVAEGFGEGDRVCFEVEVVHHLLCPGMDGEDYRKAGLLKSISCLRYK